MGTKTCQLLVVVLILSGVVAAQDYYAPPTLTLSASSMSPPTGCDPEDALSGFTCNPIVHVVWNLNGSPCDDQTICHYEYCLTQDPTLFRNTPLLNRCFQPPSPWTSLAGASIWTLQLNGANVLYGEYRTAACQPGVGCTYAYSLPTSPPAAIFLNETGPAVSLNSPAGVLNRTIPDSPLTLAQAQVINSDDPQWITYSGVSPVGESLTFELWECPTSGTCMELEGELGTTSFMWEWAAPPSPPTGYTWIQAIDNDQAGGEAKSSLPSGADGVATFFSASEGAYTETCYPLDGTPPSFPNPVQCTPLADAQSNDFYMVGDMPDVTQTACNNSQETIAFSGYADLSMRGDALINSATNPFGTNLYMLYGHPQYWNIPAPMCSHTGVVEVHLAESSTSGLVPGGTNWTAYCSGADCSSPKPVTPIWPTEPFCTGPGVNGIPCTAPCGVSGYSGCFSSHEVPNFWPYIDPNTQTQTWYAVHLMYWVPPGRRLQDFIYDGCLVISASSSPTMLGWSLGNGPADCSTTTSFPNAPNNAPLTWDQLNLAVPGGASCYTWGEPAIMVNVAPPGAGSGPVVWLAAACFNSSFVNQGYYFFYTNLFTTVAGLTWHYYSGPFSTVPDDSYTSGLGPNPPTAITELDWALLADKQTVVALITPIYYPELPGTGPSFQYGCAAVKFDVLNTTPPFGPFGSVIAVVNDTDGSAATGGIWEWQGQNGCTYEPTSNTGIIVVRHLLDTSLTGPNESPAQYQLYSLLDSGVLP
jgi:hypothetical protein